jgi:glucose/arabinose dehydrogenase
MHIASAPGDPDHLYVVEQRGVVMRFDVQTRTSSPFIEIPGQVNSASNERGMFSIAFDPRYAENRRVYVNYTRDDGDVVVSRFRATEDGTHAPDSSQRPLLRVEHSSATNHNGGSLLFVGRCGLHVSIGDGGGAGDSNNDAQRLDTRLGKLVRIGVCGGGSRIVAIGLRNPWRIDRDSATGIVYVADVGQGTREEVSLYRPWQEGLENYGWRRWEGTHRYSSTPLRPGTRYVRPIREYAHTDGRCSITGGVVYRDDAIREARGRYFYGDYCTGTVWSFRFRPGDGVSGHRREAFALPDFTLVSFGRGPGGRVYVVNRNGSIHRIAQG